MVSTSDKFTDAQQHVLGGIRVTLAVVAMLFSASIPISYGRFRSLRRPSYKLVLALAVADFCSNFAYALGDPRSGSGLCTTQGIMITFFDLASIGWTVAIGHTLYNTVVLQGGTPDLHRLHAGIWTTSFVLALLPLATNDYASAGPWCWVQDTHSGNLWRFFVFYLPLWVCFGVNVFFYWIAVRTINLYARFGGTTNGSDGVGRLHKLSQQLTFYPLAFVVSWTFITCVRISNVLDPRQEPVFWLTVVQVCLSPMFLQAVLNTLAYNTTPAVRDRWARLFKEAMRDGGRNWTVLFDLREQADANPFADAAFTMDDDEDDDEEGEGNGTRKTADGGASTPARAAKLMLPADTLNAGLLDNTEVDGKL